MRKFVIYTPNHKDYLVTFDENGIGWNGELPKAHFFRTFEQAEPIAKQIVAQMRQHSAPYPLFVREVKEKDGQWKVKGEIEIPPEPDRTKFFRQNPELRGRVSESLPSKPDVCPIKYVIYQVAKDDYLANVEEIGNFKKTAWSPRPDAAIGYTTFVDAERVAGELVISNGYELTVCELHQTEDQYWTKGLRDLFPINASLN